MLQKDSLLNEYAKWSVDLSRFRGILTYISMGKDIPDLRDQLYQDYCDVRSELGISSDMKNRYYGKLEYDDLLVEAFMGNKTWDIAMEEFIKKWKKDPEMELKNGYPSIKINYLYNLFRHLSHCLVIRLTAIMRRAIWSKMVSITFTGYFKLRT